MFRLHKFAFLLLFTLDAFGAEHNYQPDLPTIGNVSSALVSTHEERKLGKAWLRALRKRTRSYHNPLLTEYLYNLIYKLAPASHVADKDFTLTIVDSPTLNAFAVPGSIIGINAGLLFHTQNEHELASVIAHELAHLSQRHYARQVEQQQKSTPLQLVGMLASAILIATSNTDAGIAAMASTQALAIDSQLRFSRKNEQEADRIGIQTLFHSNFDPNAMSKMFERMYKESKASGSNLPEYLSTHPLSETRISDTKSRAEQLAKKFYKDNVNFHFCRVMIISDYAESKQRAADSFSKHTNSINQTLKLSSLFGQAYSLLDIDPKSSLLILEELKETYANNIYIELVLAAALAKNNKKDQAIKSLESLLEKNPDNYAITYTLAEHYFGNDQIDKAVYQYRNLSTDYPETPHIWFHLAETEGIAGNILELHQARAEYYFLTANIDKAIKHLNLALKQNPNTIERSKIQSRLDSFYHERNNPIF